tara:strand:+ start:371 stop:598 length:228 start_codon:yes stop_codon:yes gene_type:complete
MKVLRVVEAQVNSDKVKAMFEINRLLTLHEPPAEITTLLIEAIESYSAASLGLEIVQKLIEEEESINDEGLKNED